MTRPDRNLDMFLSRALHEAVDPVEPAGDGLEKIRRRLAEPWLARQARLLVTECRDLGWLIRVHLEPAFAQLRTRLSTHARVAGAHLTSVATRIGLLPRYDATHRGQPAGTGGLGRLRPTIARLRPVLAVAAAVLIVVAGVYALGQLHQTVSPEGYTGTNVTPSSSGSASPTPGPSHSSRPPHHAQPASGPVGAAEPASSPTPTPSCSATSSPTPSPTASAISSASATPTPSASATPTPSPTTSTTPTPSPSPSANSSPISSGNQSQHAGRPGGSNRFALAAFMGEANVTSTASQPCPQSNPLSTASPVMP